MPDGIYQRGCAMLAKTVIAIRNACNGLAPCVLVAAVLVASLLPYPSCGFQTDSESIDRHALDAAPEVEKNTHDLAVYLVRPARNEREQVRAIFRWIAEKISYDTQGFLTGIYGDLSPEGVLRRRVAVCEGYAGLFVALCQAAGIEAIKIRGCSKGYGFALGEGTCEESNHTWNAVKIDDKWHLLDVTWGAGYLDDAGVFVRRFEDHYFLTPPREFVFDHLPDDPQWQLLAHPVSRSEYADLVYLRPTFFHMDLEVISHPSGTISTEDGISITLGAPKTALVIARLKAGDREMEKSLVFVQRQEEGFVIHAVLPRAGDYVLSVYGKQKNDPGMYSWVLDYGITATRGSGDTAGFPETLESYLECGAHLFSPMEGGLKIGSTQRFQVHVPGAERVAVVVGGEWAFLDCSSDMFQGEVRITARSVGLYAKFPNESQYAALLKYKVLDR